LSVPSDPVSQAHSQLKGRGGVEADLRGPSGCPQPLRDSAPDRVAVAAPSLLGSGSGGRSGPYRPRRGSPRRRVLSFSGPGPQLPLPRFPHLCAGYSPPTRYMLAAMAVPAAASGCTKRTGLCSRRSPQRGAGTSRECRWGSRSRHLPLPQPSRFIPARAVAAAATASLPGRLGRRWFARLLPERARFLSDRSQAPALPRPR
jgi:hypothetical protein